MQAYAKYLLFALLFATGAFQVIKGITSIRARNESTIFGVIRILVGAILLALPIPIFMVLRQSQG